MPNAEDFAVAGDGCRIKFCIQDGQPLLDVELGHLVVMAMMAEDSAVFAFHVQLPRAGDDQLECCECGETGRYCHDDGPCSYHQAPERVVGRLVVELQRPGYDGTPRWVPARPF